MVQRFQRYSRGQRDAQTDGLTTILRTPYWGGVINKSIDQWRLGLQLALAAHGGPIDTLNV